MLDELRIRRLGVIDDALLPLGPGLTVVTGETGAGKTMVVTGLLLLFGGRADAARVRTGADQATVDGRLRIPRDSPAAQRVRDAGGELDLIGDGEDPAALEAELVVRRVVNATGRSRAHVGGAAAPVAVLADLAESLLTVHGQSDQVRLARPSAQRVALDTYASVDLTAYRAAFAAWRSAADALADRVGRAAELRREADVLTHGIAEIEAAAPLPDEAEELARVASRLRHADALTSAARHAHDALLGIADDPLDPTADVLSLLASAGRATAQQRGADADLDALAARLDELAVLAADLGADFASYAEALDSDPARLEQVESRRADLNRLVRKYCDEPVPTLAGVLRWAASARARLDEIDVSDEAIAALRSRCAAAEAATTTAAQEVSVARHVAAAKLADAVTAELHGLAMPDAQLVVEVKPRSPGAGSPALHLDGAEVGATLDGCDEVEFLLQPHAGSPALPLGRGASGGELSRVMLAVEVCLAGTGATQTLVFDEVDAGVGGRAASEVGRRLARLSRGRQVLVVTHLAQVAAFADRHVVVDKPDVVVDKPDVVVDKPVRAGRATAGQGGELEADGARGVVASDVRVVTGDARIGELARMLAGSDSVTARRHAAELLDESQDRGGGGDHR